MKDIETFIKRVRDLNPEELVIKAASSRTEELADLNVEQMDNGLLSTGGKIQPDYSPSYANYKGFKTPNLNLEGDFHEGVYSKVVGSSIEFGSTDWKEGKLQQGYGKDIFGVTDDNLIDVIDMDMPDIIDNEITK